MEDIKINIVPPFFRGMFSAFIIMLVATFIISSCEDVRIGKSKEQLSKEMFEIDSLIKTIQLQIDSTSIEFDEFYINAQRINNGSN